MFLARTPQAWENLHRQRIDKRAATRINEPARYELRRFLRDWESRNVKKSGVWSPLMIALSVWPSRVLSADGDDRRHCAGQLAS